MYEDGSLGDVLGGVTKYFSNINSLIKCTDLSERVMIYFGDVVGTSGMSVTVPSSHSSVGVGR